MERYFNEEQCRLIFQVRSRPASFEQSHCVTLKRTSLYSYEWEVKIASEVRKEFLLNRVAIAFCAHSFAIVIHATCTRRTLPTQHQKNHEERPENYWYNEPECSVSKKIIWTLRVTAQRVSGTDENYGCDVWLDTLEHRLQCATRSTIYISMHTHARFHMTTPYLRTPSERHSNGVMRRPLLLFVLSDGTMRAVCTMNAMRMRFEARTLYGRKHNCEKIGDENHLPMTTGICKTFWRLLYTNQL